MLFAEVSWKKISICEKSEMPAQLYEWLSDSASMTTRLKKEAKQLFEVKVRFQSWQSPLEDERQLLQIDVNDTAMIREVDLCCDGVVWIFGRSVFPKEILAEKGVSLLNLGTRALGELLFSDPTLQRGPIEIAILNPEHFLFNEALIHFSIQPSQLWARRSLFYISSKPLLVTEVFLPSMPYVS